ncbi:MAG: ATP-binding protein [Candidatus Omnitrophota bacterium]
MNGKGKKMVIRKGQKKTGRLKIGDNWNAITIIALSQNNPLKAIAEFVENSIDAKAKNITIVRGRKKGKNFLKISDDGNGIPKNSGGQPDFKYVATHICDSVKKRLKKEGVEGIQGEFGIGLLSFWTVGKNLELRCCGNDEKVYQMKMESGKPGYKIITSRALVAFSGTELVVTDLLSGLRQLSGEKIQRYLASELRDRIRQGGVEVRILDRFTRKEYLVEPRKYSGQLIYHKSILCEPLGEVYAEIYLNDPRQENQISLYRSGTRVLPSVCVLDIFNKEPWLSQYFQGILDAPFLQLTPGTRDGVIHDDRLKAFADALGPLEYELNKIVEQQKKQQDEAANRNILKTVQRALQDAILSLPDEEYDWFDVYTKGKGPRVNRPADVKPYAVEDIVSMGQDGSLNDKKEDKGQKQFFEYAGPLHRVKIVPASCTISVGQEKVFTAVCRDKSNRTVDDGLKFQWKVLEGSGRLSNHNNEMTTFAAPEEPELCRLGLTVSQYATASFEAETIITVTDQVIPEVKAQGALKKGLPGYTLQKAPGELWRSKYDRDKNIVIVNSGHRDFIYSSRQKSRKVRYICSLYIKELVLANFLELNREDLLERMIEVSLYAEEALK